MKKITLISGLIVTLTSQIASAEKDPKADLFASLDLDKNGAITSQEASANKALATVFKKLDKDQDGVISKAEFELFTSNPVAH